MGWNSDFALDCHYELRDDDFTWQANQLAERGFNAAGYKTFVFDCGWEASSKDGTPGYLKRVFPNGPQEHASWLKWKGFNMGLGTWGGKINLTKDLIEHGSNEKLRLI
ncbi:uncharacterized protein PGTG_14052 [Puccinia graminis f. sp. tritici CRL 75-36-700-3]|uniref:alpha-galactosidase n=1 Tax=Puccinia graminis f. sp. tritici (strain CRL 75-36-700-3 / race SCCL) TaxID=418459 RepID=E3KVZ9_PUCGT|nr:uncharacterized protein PGTG_14052 [Puccinia graminis f. sp. tritici CRL 75-36-700-3]EFP88474.1 hypothetical protein PGTG_14052 [Puccinia graminis f. sp. tritici CRL 75-36-700-3]